MSEGMVTYNGVEFAESIDPDGELYIYIPAEGRADAWITREDAVMIIEHLQKVFEIKA